MKKVFLFAAIVCMIGLTSCASYKYMKVKYRVIELTGVDDTDKYGKPESFDAVIQIGYNYYSALLTDKMKIIYIGEIVGNKKDGVVGED